MEGGRYGLFWYVIIVLCMLYPISVSVIGYRQKRNFNDLTLLISSCVVFFFMAFRAQSVGADTKQYCFAFEQIRKLRFFDIFTTPIFGVGGVRTEF